MYYTYMPCFTYIYFVLKLAAGIQVIYDLSRPKGDRVVELMARCNNCRMPTYHSVEPKVN